MPFTRSELRGKRVHWLVTLHLRGRVYRFSEGTRDVTNAHDGTQPGTLRYQAGLQSFGYQSSVTLPGEVAPDTAVNVSVTFSPQMETGWETVANADQDLGDAWGEVAELVDGDDYRERRVVARGPIDAVSYGARGEPVDLTVSARPWEDASRFPAAELMVSSDRWPRNFFSGTHVLDESLIGQMYTMVYGAPGVLDSQDDVEEILAMPALLVEVQITFEDNFSAGVPQPARLLLVGADASATGGTVTIGNLDADMTASPGTAMDRGGGKVSGLTPDLVADDQRDAVVIVDVAGTDLYVTKGDQLFWSCDSSSAGGLWDLERSGPMRGAGDILLDLLERSSLAVDRRRMETFRVHANAWKLDFFVNESRSAWETITSQVLPWLPACHAVGADGHYFVWWPYDAMASQAVAHIDPSSWGGERTSRVQRSSPNDVQNHFTLRYALDFDADRYVRATSVVPIADGLSTSAVHPYCYASWTRYGLRQAAPVECPVIYDRKTAYRWLDWQARSRATTHQEVSYRLPIEFRGLPLGAVVTITDSDIAWSDKVCIVTGVPHGPSRESHTFRTVPNMLRDVAT